jgi:nitrogen fixation protein FixH
MQQNKNNSAKPVLWFFIIFFSTFIIVDIAYIIIAEKTWRGLATKDGYKKGLNYNENIAGAKQQKALGWKMQIQYSATSSKNGNLEIILTDKNHNKIKNAQIIAKIKRPVQDGFDFSVPLKFNQKTSFWQSPIKFPLIGQWDIEIIAEKNGNVYQDGKRLVIR